MFGKSSNDSQENPKDAQKSTNFQEKHTKPTETTELVDKNQKLTAEKDNLNNQLNASQKQVKALQDSQQVLKNEKAELSKDKDNLTKANAELKTEKDNLTKDKTELTEKNKALTTEKTELNNKITGLVTEKERLVADKERLTKERDNLTKDKENLTKDLSTAKTQAEQTSQKLNELERRHAPYQKLEKLYEVFLEVKDRLNFGFVEKTHSAMDLIASVLSDSKYYKYYLESLYNKASQELSDKRSDKGEKLAELFDLLFEYIKDSKFERLKEPSAYDYSCKTLYPEQNSSQKIQRVVLRGYKHNDKVYHTIVDMGS
ncbi:hypothetical protein [Helicobacter pylori]|uniref:hypothetical protein n=1 Tax=Helicobacter pylori TaxID=210 RepID=UPI0002B948DE|nr:hypothetical protein [Helicobacter pylori]MDO7808303.1 hypothetical protein [Helicobacter pylori]MDO7814351.1 hypothetical protein [Helicobacter pylori]MDO7819275.1 hypothetical protein [Helicobacter pylori]MDO7827822.1 hypothetical protein [Helicobacter pylori]MDO7865396.1 hypothetical protein [Helicobacter pylori]